MKWQIPTCLLLLSLTTVQASVPRYVDRVIEREGVQLNVRVEALTVDAPTAMQAGQQVRIKINGKRLADDQPLSNWRIGAWLDRETDVISGAIPVCGQRVSRYLSSNLVQRPLLDLTGYYVLSLDAEASVSVLDPSVSFSGRSSLYGSMQLDGHGFDWIKTSDDMRLYVVLPSKKKLAIADLQTLTVSDHLTLPGRPTRLALQPGERLLWVGLTGIGAQESAVEIIDTLKDKSIDRIPLPDGYHEFAFSDDGRHAYITNRQSQSLTIVDARQLKAIHEIELGFEPLGLVFVDRQSLLWVVDAKAGRIYRYDEQGKAIDYIVLEPGLGPIKLTPDTRFALVVNPSQHRVHVLDVDSGKQKHQVTVSGQPYDVMFSDRFAYVRTLQSEQVGLLSLASLDDEQSIIKFVPAGAGALADTNNLLRASSMALTLDRAGAFFVTPSERTLHHYMEGMNAPRSGLRTYGHTPMSAMVIQRGLREVNPGEYTAVIRLPSAGRMVLALASEVPVLRECLGMEIESSVASKVGVAVVARWLSDGVQKVKQGESVDFRVKIEDNGNDATIDRLWLRIVPAQGGTSIVWLLQADAKTKGEWFISGKLPQSGGYYVYLEGNQPLQSPYSTVLVDQ